LNNESGTREPTRVLFFLALPGAAQNEFRVLKNSRRRGAKRSVPQGVIIIKGLPKIASMRTFEPKKFVLFIPMAKK
jgi:hypothetical protein